MQLGSRHGRNVVIEHGWGVGELDRQDELAAELVRLKVDVIVAAGGHRTVRAAKKATTSVPIVMTIGTEPVAAGLVASLGRPGGNVTGLYTLTAELGSRRLEVLREILPSLHRVGVLWNPAGPERAEEFKNTEAAARPLRLAIQSLEVRRHRWDFANHRDDPDHGEIVSRVTIDVTGDAKSDPVQAAADVRAEQ